jgi:hypothetical protein
MRAFLVSLASIAVFPLGLIACVGDDNGAPPGTDAGPQPIVDGAAPFDATMPDGAQPSEAGSDTGTDTGVDAGPQPVTITVVDPTGAPESGKTVVFHDATGAATGTDVTNAQGTVVRMMQSGEAITVLLGAAPQVSAITIFAVEPGDHLTTLDVTAAALRQGGDQVTVDAYPANPPQNFGFQLFAGNCSTSGAAPASLYVDQTNCENLAGGFPLLAIGFDDGDQENAFAFAKPAIDDGGLDEAGNSHATLAGGTWSTSLAQHTLSVSNVGPIDAGGFSPESLFLVEEVASGVKHEIVWTNQSGDAVYDGGVFSISGTGHIGYPDFVQTEVGRYANPNSTGYFSLSATRTAAPTAAQAYAADFSTLLPLLDSLSVDTPDGGSSGQPVFTWTATGSLAVADGVIVQAQWQTNPSDGGAQTNGVWTFVLPPSTTTFQPPTLPASAGAWMTTADTSFETPPVVAAIEGTFLNGYKDVRANAGSIPVSQDLTRGYTNGGGYIPPLPVDGTLRLTAATQGGD